MTLPSRDLVEESDMEGGGENDSTEGSVRGERMYVYEKNKLGGFIKLMTPH